MYRKPNYHRNSKPNFRNNYRNNNRNNNRDNSNNSNTNNISSDVKQKIIDFIYSKVRMNKYNYKMIEYEADLQPLRENKYLIAPNYTGINSLLVFKKIYNKFYSVLVDRKTLSYNQNNIDVNRLKITPISIRLDENIYNGTIIDGVLLYNSDRGVKTFVVNDIYMFEGKDLTQTKINYKMIQITKYLEIYQKDDRYLNRLTIIPNTLYDLSNTKQLINNYIPKCKHAKCIKGIAFYPEISSTKLIYLYSNASKDMKDDFIPGLQPKIKIKDIRVSNIDAGGLVKTFRMKKTDVVDVYELSLSYKTEVNDKKILKFKKAGIAYIPTKECSYFCRDTFDSNNNSSVLVECKYVPERDKWIPIKVDNNKKIPDDIEEVNNIIKKTVIT